MDKEDVGSLKFIKPKNGILKNWIKGYYVHKNLNPEFKANVTFYQNITSTISIYRDSLTSSKGRIRKQLHKPNSGFTSLLVGHVDKYQEVMFLGPLDRLAVVFHPLGISHFMCDPLSCHLKKHYSFFNHFSFDRLLPILFEESSIDRKREYLDAFFMERYSPLNEPKLLKAVEWIISDKGQTRVSDLADMLRINRRTLLRKFKKHIGYSIEEFKSVVKFRKALSTLYNNEPSPRYTELALDSGYYDQADFNHHIKERSNLTPRQLFERLELMDDTLIWKLD